MSVVLKKESPCGMIVELSSVITLNVLDGGVELRGHDGKEMLKSGERFRFEAQRKSPTSSECNHPNRQGSS